MPISINGSTGVLTGISVGGYPDGTVDADVITNSTIATTELNSDVNKRIVKAWVHAETDGDDSLVDSFNVSGVSFTNDGEIVVSFDTDFANTNYAWAGGGSRSDNTTTPSFLMCNIVEKYGDRAAGSCTLRVSACNSGGNNVSHPTTAGIQQIMAVFYGDQ